MSKGLNFVTTIIGGFIAGGLSALAVSAIIIGVVVWKPDLIDQWIGAADETEQVTSSVTEAITEITAGSNFIDQDEVVIETVKQAKPAVVSIVITKEIPIIEEYYNSFGGDPFIDPFFFPQPQYRENGTELQEVGGGSGFIVSADGYIVTNRHVVADDAASYSVFTNSGDQYEAEVIAIDTLNDVAVLKIEAQDLPYLEFGDSNALQVGQSVLAIGNALSEFNNSVSLGIVSGLARSIEAGDGYGRFEQLEDVIQTDAALNPGNSGGPLLNLRGEVVGINVAVAYDSENISFALPANLVKNAVQSAQENGKIVRPYLGVRYIDITESLQERNSLPADHGVLIARGETFEDLAVLPGSPADKAGLRENDIILEVDKEVLDENTSLANVIGNKNIGDTVQLKVLQKGEEKTIKLTLEERPSEE